MADKIRWGIIGTGRIAKEFAQGLTSLLDAELVAVGSRSQAGADKFAQEFNVAHRHPSYEALVHDADVDAVYVATPNSLHAENMQLALTAGKPVLCEKPFAINAQEAEAVIQMARAKKILLMEAMWTRFLPPIVRLREMLAEGIIGDVRMLTADIGFRRESRAGRLYDPALGGGALLDVGIYPISLASMIFGPPSSATGVAEIGPTGVDEMEAVVLRHSKGEMAEFEATIRLNTNHEVSILGTLGRIRLHRSWWRGSDMTLVLDAGGEEFLEFPFTGNGFQFEAAEFMECLREGRLESKVMPLDETLAIMKTLDTLRAQWGLKFPME
ncbi:MAG: oxidoreductase domain protein [Pedosphaera sp.]|nr:oxidoreductase domain protein [Pedosphaera sp.]